MAMKLLNVIRTFYARSNMHAPAFDNHVDGSNFTFCHAAMPNYTPAFTNFVFVTQSLLCSHAQLHSSLHQLCVCHAAMPNYKASFTNISSSIYSNGLGTGWSIASLNNSVTLFLQQAGAGLQDSAGLCINMSYTQVNDCLIGL